MTVGERKMAIFFLENKEETVKVNEISFGDLPPLSFFCRIGLDAATLKLSGRGGEIHEYVNDCLARIIMSGVELKGQACFFKMIEAIAGFMTNGRKYSVDVLRQAFGSDPSNIYVISILVDFHENSSVIKNWAERRIGEVSLWLGHEDVLLVGDSHVFSFNGVARCKICYVGSHTMHHVGENGFNFPKYRESHVMGYRAVILSFGEIDARSHVIKQHERSGLAIEGVVDEVISRYMKSLKGEFGDKPNVDVGVLGIVPPVRKQEVTDGWAYGSDEDRCLVSDLMNARLRSECKKNGYIFVDLHDGFCDRFGFISKDFWAGDHHISPIHYIELERRLIAALDKKRMLGF